MIETLIAKIGLPALVGVLGKALGDMESDKAKLAGQALEDVGAAIKAGGISANEVAEAHRHLETLAKMEAEQTKENIAQVNQSLRAEIVSEDKFVRRMRPTFGYLMAITWAAQMLAIAYIIVFQPDKAGGIMSAMGSLSAIWGVGLSVLGIYVYKRSEDKKILPTGEVVTWER
ncbi:MAG: holin family protein [Micavibrio sp.]|nr:holin family protein [Micavibrio sp.]